MATFLAAYIVVWLGVAAFVTRLGIRQRRLQQAIDDLCDTHKRSSNNGIADERKQVPTNQSRAA